MLRFELFCVSDLSTIYRLMELWSTLLKWISQSLAALSLMHRACVSNDAKHCSNNVESWIPGRKPGRIAWLIEQPRQERDMLRQRFDKGRWWWWWSVISLHLHHLHSDRESMLLLTQNWIDLDTTKRWCVHLKESNWKGISASHFWVLSFLAWRPNWWHWRGRTHCQYDLLPRRRVTPMWHHHCAICCNLHKCEFPSFWDFQIDQLWQKPVKTFSWPIQDLARQLLHRPGHSARNRHRTVLAM